MTAATKAAPEPTETDAPSTVLILRSCRADGGSHSDWKYPLVEGAVVECPDWSDKPACGGGFHGLLWGEGDCELMCWDADAWWQVFEVAAVDVVKIDDSKVKFRRGRQVFLRAGLAPGYVLARAYVNANRPKPKTNGAASTAGYRAPVSTAGDLAPASTAGDLAPASTAGYLAPASTAGDRAPASTAGDLAPASTAGYRAPASTAGDRAPASTAGEASIAACLGFDATARAGPRGCVIVTWWDGDEKTGRPRVAVGYVGEGGIERDTWYRADEKGQLVEAPRSNS